MTREPLFASLREWPAIVPYSVPEHVRVPPETWNALLDVAETAAQYLNTGRGDLDGALARLRLVDVAS
jgi:hypothetical protein